MESVKVILILFAIITLIMCPLLIFVSCSTGVDVGELNRVLTSFSIQYPEGFDYQWYTSAELPVIIHALDQNGEKFNWEGMVDLWTTNPEVILFPKTTSLVNGAITTNLKFYIYSFEEEKDAADTFLQLRHQEIMIPLSTNIHVDKLIKPHANFIADVTRGETPLTVQFSDNSTGHILNWEWDFENDSIVDSTDKNPVFSFNEPGNYTVSLKVTGPSGVSDADLEMKSRYIIAGDNVPLANFTATNVSGDPPLTVDFTDLSQGDVTSWAWDFNNDEIVDSTEQNPSYEYNDPGYYSVTLTVTGPGGTDSVTLNYYIMVYGFFSALGSPGFSEGGASYITLCIDNGKIYIAYMDSSYSGKSPSGKATVKMFNGTNWETVGIEPFSEGEASYISLYVYNDTPYVTYMDGANSNKSTIMKYNGTSWEAVGNEGFSGGEASYTSLFVYDGTPYIAFTDGAHSNKATVMKYNGTFWEAVGGEGFSEGEASYTSLFVYDGTPYIAFTDGAHSNKATVMKFNGTSWEAVGSEGFSAGQTDYISLTSDSSDIPYIAYRDGGNTNKATVMKYTGSGDTGWVPVDIEGFSAGEASYISLYVYNDTPYVTYMDGANSNKSTIMKYNGTSWEAVGNEGFSGGEASYTSLCVHNDTPYIAYMTV
jgi:PKD repeat protein